MTTMIERVARAICQEEVGALDYWETYLPLARAAIAAMREPTERMSAAAYPKGRILAGKKAWQAMIDAALKGE